MKKYKIIYFESEWPSFSWQNGLYAVISTTEDLINICLLDKMGKPTLSEDGEFVVTLTRIENKGVKETNLTLDLDIIPLVEKNICQSSIGSLEEYSKLINCGMVFYGGKI